MFFIGEPVSTSPEHALDPLPAGSAVPTQLEAVNAAFPRTNLLRHPRFIHTCLFRQIQLFVVMNDR